MNRPILLTGAAIISAAVLLGSFIVRPSRNPVALNVNFPMEELEAAFGGLGGIKAQPFTMVTDPAISSSPATTTRFIGGVIPSVNNSFDLGSPSSSWRNVYASGTISGHLKPTSNNTYDVGAYGNAYKDVYASGSLKVGGAGAGLSTSTFSNGAVFAVDGGNVGIGTATPSAKLEVNGISNVVKIFGNSSGGADYAPLVVRQNQAYDSPYTQYVVNFENTAGTDLWSLRADGRMFVQTNTGIGIGSPNDSLVFTTTGLDFNSDRFSFKDDSQIEKFRMDTGTGYLYVATSTSFGSILNVDTLAATNKGMVIRAGATGQSANLFEAQTGVGTPVAWINPSGGIGASGTSYLAGILSPTNNGSDLGAYGNAWKNVYASGTIFASTFGPNSAIATSTFTGKISTPRLLVTGLTAAPTAINPICVDATGETYIGSSSICPLSALSAKEDLLPISYGLDEILKTDFYDFKTKNGDGRTHSGPIADYSDKVMPNLTEWRDGQINGFDYLSMIGVEGQAIKELDAKIEKQQKQIDALKREILRLRSEVYAY